jgi:UDPglucose--hexose-1-phosphate uridylyltransferase
MPAWSAPPAERHEGDRHRARAELRRDALSGHLVVVAPGRALRPGAATARIAGATAEELETCPFCEGREDRTPPETLALPPRRPADSPGWRVRAVPNLYPAFERQEVVVHSPHHVRTFAELDDEQIDLVAHAWRLRAQSGDGYLHALINEGKLGGASLAHSHSQLVWIPVDPPALRAERGEPCRLCALLASERAEGTHVVEDADGAVVLCPPAGRVPYELLIAPLEHEADAFSSACLAAALRLLRDAVRRLHAIEGAVAWNAWVHGGEHWHVEALPRLTIPAGVELGAGISVNPMPPEDAAAALRDVGDV